MSATILTLPLEQPAYPCDVEPPAEASQEWQMARLPGFIIADLEELLKHPQYCDGAAMLRIISLTVALSKEVAP